MHHHLAASGEMLKLQVRVFFFFFYLLFIYFLVHSQLGNTHANEVVLTKGRCRSLCLVGLLYIPTSNTFFVIFTFNDDTKSAASIFSYMEKKEKNTGVCARALHENLKENTSLHPNLKGLLQCHFDYIPVGQGSVLPGFIQNNSINLSCISQLNLMLTNLRFFFSISQFVTNNL